MEIIYLNKIDSTHIYLKNYIKLNTYKNSIAIVSQNQTNGIGSRDNNWEGKNGNLFFSFVIKKEDLPNDLPLQSASIYFSFILKEILMTSGSKVWMKWPNDFYIKDKKIGGTITNIGFNLIFCGIGLNLVDTGDDFGCLDIVVKVEEVLKKYFNALEKYPSWKQIFSKFEIEFKKNENFKTNIEEQKILLKDVRLQIDGSLLVNGKKVFSLR